MLSFYSGDGGRSWRSVALPGCRIDPWVEFELSGTALLSCLASDGASTLVFRSTDGGATWLGPATVPSGRGSGPPDRPTLAVGQTAATADVVYLSQGQGFEDPVGQRPLYGPSISRSRDGGLSFEPPYFERHDNLHQQPFDGVVFPDGRVGVFFMDYLAPGRGPLRHRRVWMTRSEGEEGRFSRPVLVHEQSSHEVPWSLALEPSGGPCGRLYMVVDGLWFRTPASPEAIAAAAALGLYVVRSIDCGDSWSQPVPVTEPVPRSNQETPVVAVNSRGVVGVAWYDTRHSASGLCFDLYFAASFDGGMTFGPSQRITERTSCPHDAAHPGLARRWAFGGDYSGLAAAADGAFHILWADTQDGVYQLRTARIVGLSSP